MATRNIVPRANGEGGIGTAAKRWLNGFFNTITGGTQGNHSDLVVNTNTVYDTSCQLTTADFPNTTTLYIYNCDNASSTNFSDVGGAGKTLTLTGTLTAANDVLGVSRYNVFDGSNDYLSSADAVFNFTGDFSVGGWFYQATWSTISADQSFISRYSGGNGWILDVETTEEIYFKCYSGGLKSQVVASCANLSAGWHHIVATRNSSTHYLYLYIDGQLVNSQYYAADAITAGGNLEVGSTSGGSNKLAGRPDEVFIHNATILTLDQVKKPYARSAKKFAVADANGNIAIPELNVSSGVYTPTVTAVTNVTGTPTGAAAPWSRIGNVVTCSFDLTIDPTASAPTITNVYVTLPIACTSTPTAWGCGINADYSQVGYAYGQSALQIKYEFSATNGTSTGHVGTFMYVVN